MNIFIAGGAGYIGSATGVFLLDDGHTVTVYDSLVTGHRAAVPKNARFIKGDLADGELLFSALTSEKYDAVLDFAAFIEAGESMKDPGKFFKNNISNSLQLMEKTQAAGIKRFVLSSTAAVYQSSDAPLTEDSPISPSNPYGYSKYVVEQSLEWYRKVHGLHFAALRYFNACGAIENRGEAHQPESHLIPGVLSVPMGRRESIKIFGGDYPTPDGTCIRDYIHIEDLALAHLLAVEALEEKDRLIYNIGNGNGYSNLQIVEAARKITGHPIPVQITPRRAGDPARLVASSDKIRNELGWRPRHIDLAEIIASAWDWHREHPHGYTD